MSVLFLGACSSDPKQAGGDASSDCTGAAPAATYCLKEVVGRVVDENHAAVSDLDVTVCGPVCYRGVTDKAGQFAIAVDAYVVPGEYSVQPHGGPTHSTFYYALPGALPEPVFDAGELRVVALPAEGSLITSKAQLAGASPPAQVITSGPVQLEVAEGTLVRLTIRDALALDDPEIGDEARRFRAVELSAADAEHFAPTLDDALVFALGPFEADFLEGADGQPDVSVTIEVGDKWADGTELEILALGTYLDPQWLPPASFSVLGSGVVVDGSVHLPGLAEGEGLHHLTWLAVQAR